MHAHLILHQQSQPRDCGRGTERVFSRLDRFEAGDTAEVTRGVGPHGDWSPREIEGRDMERLEGLRGRGRESRNSGCSRLVVPQLVEGKC